MHEAEALPLAASNKQWQSLSLHKRKRESLCKPGIMHSSRLDQGVVGPVAVPSSLRKKRADLTLGSRGQTEEFRQGPAFKPWQ